MTDLKLSEKNIEVEIRALVPDLDPLKEKLLARGGVFLGEYYIRDIYFCRQEFSELKDVEMNQVGSYGLRLRKSRDNNSDFRLSLNTKTITSAGDHNSWEEHELVVGDFQEAAAVLKNIGFKPFFDLEKNRYHYQCSGLDIFLEDIKNFGACVELEKMVFPGEEAAAKQEILEFLKSLDIDDQQIVPKSVTNIIMRDRAFKGEISI